MDVASLISNSQNELNTLNNQVASSEGALNDFTKTQKSAGDFYNQAQTDLGVQGARDTQTNAQKALNLTQGLINNLPNSVTGRTQGSLVTEAQRQRLLANELNPLQQQYGSQSQAYNQAQGLLQDLLGQASQQAGLGYQSQQDRYKQLQDALSLSLTRKNSAQDLLNWALGQKSSMDQFNAQMAENKRQFDAQQAAAARQAAAEQIRFNTQRQDAADELARQQAAAQYAADMDARYKKAAQFAKEAEAANQKAKEAGSYSFWDFLGGKAYK